MNIRRYIMIVAASVFLCSTCLHAKERSAPQYRLTVDPFMSMYAGADDVFSAYTYFTQYEDAYAQKLWVKRHDFTGNAENMLLRFLKVSIVDDCVTQLPFIFQHEYFGHGARDREVSKTYRYGRPTFDIGSRYSVLPPFILLLTVNGGSYATSSSNISAMTRDEKLLLYTGGSEANYVLSNVVVEQMVQTGETNYYLGRLYWAARLDALWYIESMHDETSNDFLKEGHDFETYLKLINEKYGYTNPSSYALTANTLRTHAFLSLADPLVWYSLYSKLKYYYNGETTSRLPFIHYANMRFLPSLYMNTTPFGFERYCSVYGMYNDDTYFTGYVRVGDDTFQRVEEFCGVGLEVKTNRACSSLLRGYKIDVWRQPMNSFAGCNIFFDIHPRFFPTKLDIGLGYKTEGYVIGEQMSEGVYCRVYVMF